MSPCTFRRSRLFVVSQLVALSVLALLSLPSLSAQKKPNAQDLLKQMTLKEKIA